MAKRLSDNTSNTLKTQLKTLSDEPVVSDELREQVAVILTGWFGQPEYNGFATSPDWGDLNTEICSLITQYANKRERATIIGELQRIDVANTGNGINFWFEDYPTNNGWATMKQYTEWRLSELRKEEK